MSIFSVKHIFDSFKAAVLLMGYCIGVTIFIWIGMYLVSYIPIIGQGPKALFNLQEITVFWTGTITGILSLFVVAFLNGGKLTYKMSDSPRSERNELRITACEAVHSSQETETK